MPFRILAGNPMNSAASTDRIFHFAHALVRHARGGPAHVNVIASVIFSGMSGSAAADADGLGAMEIEAMHEADDSRAFAGAVTVASGIIGPPIPPSIPMVSCGVLDEVGDAIRDPLAALAAGARTGSEALGHREFVLGYKTFEPIGPARLPGERSRSASEREQ